ncbi:DNA polymerase III subunit chi [Catenovulum sp. SM1970]|uniref:DNA polymerase III subunit chi n=1 Tax=Marinifaba aquimaris TaxID=2741323 RepID=UPI0015735A07|nr:DNA polymerase III subunit chi [Marinifaba aquimaris]NTS75553.1 DNA polymerase III subunit chi [Marinifaba aquimaris]
MSAVHFYLFDETYEQVENVPAHIDFACRLAAHCYRQNQKIFIYTGDQTQANQVDEYLWQFDAQSFVAHNLQGEGPKFGSPVEIGCEVPKGSRQILINLSPSMPDFAKRYPQVFDFVPHQEELKQVARERYKQYKQSGHQLTTEPAYPAQ